MLLAGFVPLLQVTFIVIGRIATGLLAVKDREEVQPNFRTPPSY